MTIYVPKGLLQCPERARKANKRQLFYLFFPQLENPKSLVNEKDPTQITKESVKSVIIKFLSLLREIADVVPLQEFNFFRLLILWICRWDYQEDGPCSFRCLHMCRVCRLRASLR